MSGSSSFSGSPSARLVLATWVLLSLNLFLCVALYQANVLTWDQWDFYTPLFKDRGLWALFDFQHGPHRQGLGFVVTSWILQATHWDTRADCLWITLLLSASAGLALRLKWKITGALRWTDLWIPVLGLTLAQFEAILITPNSSHSAFPLMLMLGWANFWFIRKPVVRYVGSGFAAIALTFTGFGIFAGAVVTLLLGGWSVRHALNKEWKAAGAAVAGLLLAAGGWIVFSSNYVFAPAVAGFRFPWTPLTDYLRFIPLMLLQPSGVFGESPWRYAAGGFLSVLVLFAAIACSWRWFRSRQPSPAEETIFLLVIAGALFVVNTAVGRVCLGITAGMSSRYVTLMFPLWLGVYLFALGGKKRLLPIIVTSAITCLAVWPYADMKSRPLRQWPGTLGATHDQFAYFEQYTANKAGWVDTYLKTNRWEQAQAEYGIAVYPAPAATHLEDKLAFLRSRRLSFFARDSRQTAFLPWWLPDRFIWNDEFPTTHSGRRLEGTSKLTFVTKKNGYVELSLSTPGKDASATPLRFDIEYRGKKRMVSIDHMPASLVFPVECGYNTIKVSPASAVSSPPVEAAPPHFVPTPPAGAVVVE